MFWRAFHLALARVARFMPITVRTFLFRPPCFPPSTPVPLHREQAFHALSPEDRWYSDWHGALSAALAAKSYCPSDPALRAHVDYVCATYSALFDPAPGMWMTDARVTDDTSQ